jgi:hypothetical protein
MSKFMIADSLHEVGKKLAAANDLFDGRFDDFMCQVMSLHSRPEIEAIAMATRRLKTTDLCIRVPVEQEENLVISFNPGGLRFYQEVLKGSSSTLQEVEPKDYLIKHGINNLKELNRTWRVITEQLEKKAGELLT